MTATRNDGMSTDLEKWLQTVLHTAVGVAFVPTDNRPSNPYVLSQSRLCQVILMSRQVSRVGTSIRPTEPLYRPGMADRQMRSCRPAQDSRRRGCTADAASGHQLAEAGFPASASAEPSEQPLPGLAQVQVNQVGRQSH